MNIYFILSILHDFFLIFNALIILFCNNIFILSLNAIFMLIILLVNYLFKNCPITVLEKKYMSTSLFDYFVKLINNKDDIKEGSTSTLTKEMLWIALLLTLVKITFIVSILALNKNFCTLSCSIIKKNSYKFIDILII